MLDIQAILHEAKMSGASDVHLTVGIPPKMRVNSRLVTMNYHKMTASDTLEVVLEVLSPAQRERFEKKGECDVSFSIPEEGRYRVNVYKQGGAAALAFRLIAAELSEPEMLGIPKSVMDLYKKTKGLVLVTGPAGGGKSTTLAAIIDKINRNREAHIITLESPVEYLHEHKQSMVNQREIGTDSENYPSALRAALREDPDVILVGEMRDAETIEAAITAAEAGHLVLAALHTTGVVNSLERMGDLFLPNQQQQIRKRLINVLEAVISQQLIPTAEERRRAVFEVMLVNNTVRSMIREGKLNRESILRYEQNVDEINNNN